MPTGQANVTGCVRAPGERNFPRSVCIDAQERQMFSNVRILGQGEEIKQVWLEVAIRLDTPSEEMLRERIKA